MVVLGFHIPPFLDFQIAVPLDVNYRDGAYIMSHVDRAASRSLSIRVAASVLCAQLLSVASAAPSTYNAKL